jgi:hypothetical protein
VNPKHYQCYGIKNQSVLSIGKVRSVDQFGTSNLIKAAI